MKNNKFYDKKGIISTLSRVCFLLLLFLSDGAIYGQAITVCEAEPAHISGETATITILDDGSCNDCDDITVQLQLSFTANPPGADWVHGVFVEPGGGYHNLQASGLPGGWISFAGPCTGCAAPGCGGCGFSGTSGDGFYYDGSSGGGCGANPSGGVNDGNPCNNYGPGGTASFNITIELDICGCEVAAGALPPITFLVTDDGATGGWGSCSSAASLTVTPNPIAAANVCCPDAAFTAPTTVYCNSPSFDLAPVNNVFAGIDPANLNDDNNANDTGQTDWELNGTPIGAACVAAASCGPGSTGTFDLCCLEPTCGNNSITHSVGYSDNCNDTETQNFTYVTPQITLNPDPPVTDLCNECPNLPTIVPVRCDNGAAWDGPTVTPGWFLDAACTIPYTCPTLPMGCTSITVTAFPHLDTGCAACDVCGVGVTFTIYPDLAAWTETPTPGACGTAAMISITAANGDECFSQAGAVPPAGTCPSTNGEAPLAYNFNPNFATACNQVFSGTVAAVCPPAGCIDCPDIAPAITAQELCSGTDPNFVTVETEVNATGNNQGTYTYFLDAAFGTPYATQTNLTCAPVTLTIFGRLQCTDPAAAGTADEFDDFTFDITIYPAQPTASIFSNLGDACSEEPDVVIVNLLAADGVSICGTKDFDAPANITCTVSAEMIAYEWTIAEIETITGAPAALACYTAVSGMEDVNVYPAQPTVSVTNVADACTAATGVVSYDIVAVNGDLCDTRTFDADVNETCTMAVQNVADTYVAADLETLVGGGTGCYTDLDIDENVNVYPDANNFVPTETAGGCGAAANISIAAENGDECFSDTGNVPASPDCGVGGADDQSLSYSFDPGFFADCNQTYAGTIGAICASFCITDPCACNNDQNDNASGTGDGSFSETVQITGIATGEIWTVVAITANPNGTSTDAPTGIAVNDVLTDNGDNSYEISFTHFDGAGFEITVEGPNALGDPANAQFTQANNCIYPEIANFEAIAAAFCVDEADVALGGTGNDEVGFAGTYTYVIDGNTVTEISPATLGAGSYDVEFTFVGDFVDNQSADGGTTPAYPGCETTFTLPIEINALPDPSFTCPTTIDRCSTDAPNTADGFFPFAPVTTTGGVWSGSGASFINVNNEFEPISAPLNVDLTVTYTVTDANGCIDSFSCTFQVVSTCAANGGRF